MRKTLLYNDRLSLLNYIDMQIKKLLSLIFNNSANNSKSMNTTVDEHSNFDVKMPQQSINNTECYHKNIKVVNINGHIHCNGHPEIDIADEGIGISKEMAMFKGYQKTTFLVNTKNNASCKLTDANGQPSYFEDYDFDLQSINDNSDNVSVFKEFICTNVFPYRVYRNGFCVLTLHLVRKYSSKTNENSSNKEICLYGIFDEHCNLLLPWQHIENVDSFVEKLIF